MTDPLVVLIWREAGSRRLRTYVDEKTSKPAVSHLSTVEPPPLHFLTSEEELDAYLQTPPPPAGNGPVREQVMALLAPLAESVLGWDLSDPPEVTSEE